MSELERIERVLKEILEEQRKTNALLQGPPLTFPQPVLPATLTVAPCA